MSTDQSPAPTTPQSQIAVVGPMVVLGEPVALTPALEAALRRCYERQHERLAAYYAANPDAQRLPSRYDNWSTFIQAALSDWLYGPAPAWPAEVR